MHSTQSTGMYFSTMLRLCVHQLLARYVKKCYLVYSQLFIIGGGEIQSMERTTQGDPAAMVIYVIAIIPLILMLVEIRMLDNNHTKTAAYADDLTVAGPISIIYN